MLIIFAILCIILFFVASCLCSESKNIIGIVFIIICTLMFSINKGERVQRNEIVFLSSLSNSTEITVHGGLFYTTTDSKDYLIYWTQEGSFIRRKKMEINWDTVEVYENDNEAPRIETVYTLYENTSIWFDLYRAIPQKVKTKIYVPKETILEYMELK